jgi:hypothetical protein
VAEDVEWAMDRGQPQVHSQKVVRYCEAREIARRNGRPTHYSDIRDDVYVRLWILYSSPLANRTTQSVAPSRLGSSQSVCRDSTGQVDNFGRDVELAREPFEANNGTP